MNQRLLFIFGPNLNLLGERETSLYGSMSYDTLIMKIAEEAKKEGYKQNFSVQPRRRDRWIKYTRKERN